MSAFPLGYSAILQPILAPTPSGYCTKYRSLYRARRYHGACARGRLQPDRLRSFDHALGGGRRQATGSCDHRPRRRLFLAGVHGGSFRALDHRSRCAGRLVAVHDHGRRPARLRAPCARKGLRKDGSGDQRSRCARRPCFKCSWKQRPVRRRSGGRGQRRGWRRSRGKEDGRRARPAGRILWLAQAERGVFLHSRWRGVGIDSRCDHGRHGVVEAHGTRGSFLAVLSTRAFGNSFCFERAGVRGSRPAPHGGCFCRGTVRKCGAHELLLWATFRRGPHDGVQFHRRRVHGFSALVVRGGRAGGHRSHKISPAEISDDTAQAMTLNSRSHGGTTARGLQEEGLCGCIHLQRVG